MIEANAAVKAAILEAAIALGGAGSGNWGHAGRPGQRGGSQPRGSAMSIRSGRDWQRRYKAKTGREPRGKEKAQPAGPKRVDGVQTEAFGNNPNVRYKFRTQVVSLKDLIPSNTMTGAINPDYDQALQPRVRARAASQAQIDNVAKNLVPESLLWDFHALDKGTPIIGKDMMVESGNGRALALMRAKEMHPEKWQEYQAALKANLDKHGLAEKDIAGIENPVLVRVRESEVDRAEFAKEANSPAVLQMSPLEQAAQDAHLLSPKNLSNLTVGEGQSVDQALRSAANRPFVRQFVGQLSQNERATVQRADGSLNRMGLWRLKSAIFMKVFPGDAGTRIADTFLESLDSNIKNFENAISDIMPKLAQAESLISGGRRAGNLSMAGDFSKAIDMLARLKETGMPVKHYIRQTSMFDRELSSRQERLLQAFDKVSRSRKGIRQLFERYADAVLNAPDPRQGGLFGGMGLTPEALTDRVLEGA